MSFLIGARVRHRNANVGRVLCYHEGMVTVEWDWSPNHTYDVHENDLRLESKSVVQDWVSTLPGLRHQGVLLTAVRGCDVSPKEDPCKALTRCYRSVVLNAHVGDPTKAKTFIEAPPYEEVARRMIAVAKDHDALPHHYIMHLVHAAEIVGYFHPSAETRELWFGFYEEMVRRLHLRVETRDELNLRLCADEETFGQNQ